MEDYQVAMAMQMEEVQAAEIETAEVRRIQNQMRNEVLTMYDTVWGEVKLLPFERGEDKKRQRRRNATNIFFMCCPTAVMSFWCCWPGLDHPPSRRTLLKGYSKIFISWSFQLALAQVIVMILLCGLYGMESMGDNPMFGPPFVVFNDWGAKNAALISYKSEVWRLVTPMFLHAGWIHLASNVLMQLHLGTTLEVLWGHTSWILIYIMSGVHSSLTSAIWAPGTLGVGSSGALCGLVGAWVPFIIATWNQTLPRDVKARNSQLAMVIGAILLLIPLSFAPLVDAAAHMGGLVMGMVAGTALFANRVQTREYRIGMLATGGGLLVAIWAGSIAWFAVGVDPPESLLYACPASGCPTTPPPS